MSTNLRFTRLTAINRMLRSAGEQPVNSLTEDGINDTSVAEAILNECSAELQSEQPYSVTEWLEYEPDTNGYINLPDGTLRVDAQYRTDEVTQRGYSPCRLYDLENNTFVFTESVMLQLTIGIPFEDLPIAEQLMIVDKASYMYSVLTQGDTAAVHQLLAEQALLSRARFRAANAEQGDYNLFRNMNTNAYWAVSRQRRWSRTSGRLANE